MGYKMKGFSGFKESPVKQRVSDLPKDFNRIGSSASTTPGYKPKLPKNFNTKGSGEAGKNIVSKKDVARSTKQALKNVNTVSSTTNKGNKVVQLLKKGQKVAKKIIKHPVTKKAVKVSKKVLKAGSKFGGAVFNIMPAPMINPLGEKYDEKGKL